MHLEVSSVSKLFTCFHKYGWVILLMTLAPQLYAKAPSSFLREFSAAATMIPQRILDKEVKKVGDLELDQLLSEIKSLRWIENTTGVFLAGSGETRTGAIYDLERRTIILNSGRAAFEPRDTMAIASLHEALGGLGYIDENYALSLLLKIHSLPDGERTTIFDQVELDQQNLRFRNLGRRTTNTKYVAGGGATSVGGGGDGIVVQMKWYLLLFATKMCQGSNWTCPNIVGRVLDANIEINPIVTETVVRTEVTRSKKIIRVPLISWINASRQTRTGSLSEGQLEILQNTLRQIVGDAK